MLGEPEPCPRTPFIGEKVILVGVNFHCRFTIITRNLVKSRAGEKGRVETANGEHGVGRASEESKPRASYRWGDCSDAHKLKVCTILAPWSPVRINRAS